MEATELRLGNKIYSNEFDIDNGCDVLQIVDCDYYAIHEIFKGNKVNKYSPIPITENLLLKIGFEYSKTTDKFFIKDNTFGISTADNKFRFIQGNLVCQLILRDLKYVHELQNLYYALTGNELSLSGISNGCG